MAESMFSGSELEEALKKGVLEKSQVHLVGMVKPCETEGYVRFSQRNCDTWVDIPTKLIEQAERIGSAPCRDHSHPLMRITFKELEDHDSNVFLALLAQGPMAQPIVTGPGNYPQLGGLGGGGMGTPSRLASRRGLPWRGPRLGGIRGFLGGGGFFDGGSNPCCCAYTEMMCTPSGDCWPVIYEVCTTCGSSNSCGCDAAGPYCYPTYER